ncbi:MAG: DUF5131 family protein [Vicinamibacterales bacterium]
MSTAIEWTDETWNPATGCTKVSPGCANHKKGAAICANGTIVAIDSLERAVLDALGAALFTPSVVTAVMAGVREALQPDAQATMAQRMKKDLAAVERQIANLTDAIALASSPLPPLVTKLHERRQRRDDLLASIAAADSRATVDLRLIERQVRAKLDDWRSLRTRNVQTARTLFRDVLDAPITVTPEHGGFRFEGRADMGRLLTGTACNTCGVPTGL